MCFPLLSELCPLTLPSPLYLVAVGIWFTTHYLNLKVGVFREWSWTVARDLKADSSHLERPIFISANVYVDR